MRRVGVWAGLIILAIAFAGCASPQPTSTVAPSPTALSVARRTAKRSTSVAALAVATLAVTSNPTTPTVPTTPTIVATPTITPTPGPPTATATPAPAETTLQAAENVDQALIAFAQAQSQGNTQATLDAQRKLLDAASAAAAVAATDQTSYGQQLRSALDSAQAAAAGDFDKLNDAHKALSQIEGSLTTPVVIPRPASQSTQSLSDVTQSLKQAIDEYTRANNGGNAGDLLRAQRDLLDAVANAEAATKNAHSPMAQQIQTALTAIHDGLAGDTGKFADAENDLASASSAPSPSPSATASPTASATPTVAPTTSATPTPTPSPSPTASPATTAQSGQAVDLQPLQNSVDSSLQALQNEQSDQNPANVQQAQANLRSAIQKANDAIADDHSPAADRFRSALSTAQNAANGDFTKIQPARDQLKAASGQ
ncbi:MAG: hypothetical protein ACRDIY_03935 [Chloroflexota bacterium]